MVSLTNLTLQKRISLLVLGGLAVGLGLFSWLGVQSVNESVQRTLEERLIIARVMANQVDENMTHVLLHLQNTADFNGGLPAKQEFETKAESLRQILAKSGLIARNIIFTGEDGKALQVEPADPRIINTDMSSHPTVAKTLGTGLPTISNSVSNPLIGVPVVLISTPIFNEQGEIIGALTVLVDIERSSFSSSSQTVILGKTGYTEIVDGNGLILARSKPALPPQILERSDHPDRFADLIRQGKATVRTCHRCHGTETAAERRRDVLAFAPLTTASWGVAVRQPEEEALAPTIRLRQKVLFLGMVVIMTTILLVWTIMQGIVKPVRMLTSAAQKVAAGDFQATLPVKRQDEIGQLSTAFYTMTQQLAKSRDELVLRNEELREYAAYVLHAQEEERQRIARELHDETIQTLVLLCRRLDSVGGVSESLAPSVINELREARRTTEEVIQELRDFTKALRPPTLEDLGMVASIRRLLADFKEQTRIGCQFRVVGNEQRFSTDKELGIFRIAQEALRNVERHAKATHVSVTIAFSEQAASLDVLDNGEGFSLPSVPGDFTAIGQGGLIGMHERARLLKGTLKIQSSPGKGTRVTASIPI